MTSKKAVQYKCDFCAKKGYSAPHMKHHEERCTKNPNRVCGMCKLSEDEQPAIQTLLAILPDPSQFIHHEESNDVDYVWIDDGKLEAAVKEVFPALCEATGYCPACIMAAIRQKGIPAPVTRAFFDYKKMKEEFFSSVNTDTYNE